MSVNFHSNQYEQAFNPRRTQNWELPKNTQGKYPVARVGFSNIKANSRGHLLSGVPRNRQSPWGPFVGTWDMPTKIPGNKQLNPTARCENAQLKLEMEKAEAGEVMSGGLKRCKIPSPLPVQIDPEARPENNPPYLPGPVEPSMVVNEGTFKPSKGRLTPITLPMTHQVNWPKHRVGDSDYPVGNPLSPKPPTPMALGGEGVENEARARVSPCNPEQVAVGGAVASPTEGAYGQMQNLEADVNWPIARSCEPPEI
ncbi:protein Flattop homolog [Littorina saxatilis]|uniref:Cilia- and flagella-associated protein 126 n=1 Tax=Littorina saxatilis TaxID=31220 RepID=A0AAN9BK10_9CAEN